MPQEYPPVLTKRDFVRRYKAGEFGNHSPTWNTLEELLLGEVMTTTAYYHLRNRIAGGDTYYNLVLDQLTIMWDSLNKPENWYISGMAPHHLNLIQGEVRLTHRGLELYYSTVKDKAMRDALPFDGAMAYGLKATTLLQELMCPNSWEWLNTLLERYPNHVVEFSTFDTYWGTLPHFNTVYWEVRNY